MKKENALKALKKAREGSQKRNFKQSFDLIINLKGIDNKKAEHQIDDFVELHYSKGKLTKVCALVGPELYENAKKVCEHINLPIQSGDDDMLKVMRRRYTLNDYMILLS